MASKIFLGDMPELMERIFENLDKELYSLRSCALVNRYWCRMSIPILWRNPFSFSKNPMFIYEYFSSLEEEEKLILNECGIRIEFPNTLFRYARFLKVFDLSMLRDEVVQWIRLHFQFRVQEVNVENLEYHIVNLLFRIFIESGATLSILNFYIHDQRFEFKPEIFYLLGQNKLFFSQLHELNVEVVYETCLENVITFLSIITKNSKKIRILKVDCYPGYKQRLSYAYISIIKSQEQLKSFEIRGDEEFSTGFCGIISALEIQKNSLKEIIIERCAYSSEFEVLRSCENLEVFHIFQSDEKEILETLNTSLCYLLVNSNQIDASNLIQILEKSGTLLQRLQILSFEQDIHSQFSLLNTLMTSCPNIAFLHLSRVSLSAQLLEFIGSLQKLKSLILRWKIYGSEEEEMKTHVKHLAETLPPSLQYLSVDGMPKNSYIDILLNHCDISLKRLFFRVNYKHNDYYKKIIESLIGFCIRKKSLKYVCIHDNSGAKRVLKHWNQIEKDLEPYVKLVSSNEIEDDYNTFK